MLCLTFFATSLIFRHNKDSGSWSIYNGKKLYPDIHILATALCNRHSKLFQSCQITVAHTKCLVHTCQKNCHKLYFRAQIK